PLVPSALSLHAALPISVSSAPVRFLEPAQNLSRPFHNRPRQAGKLRHLDAIGSIGCSGPRLVQKNNLVSPLLHVHGDGRKGWQRSEEHTAELQSRENRV